MKKSGFKVFISVDIEGITGVIHWDETMQGKPDYDIFRKIMANEANAAVEAAFKAGAKEVVVRDAHGSALNILPTLLHKDAKLIRNWMDSPFCMMEGLDESYDAVIFIGYHAKSNTPNAPLKHTMSGKIGDLKVNDISMSEASFNALIAGLHNVPVVFLSGDSAVCDHISGLIDGIETVPVKEGMGNACITLHPDKSRELIFEGVVSALKKRNSIKPYKMKPPYTFEMHYRYEPSAQKASWYPGAVRLNDMTVRFTADNYLDCLRFFFFSWD